MEFFEQKGAEDLGRRMGFITMYIIFTCALFLILRFMNRISNDVTIIPIAAITLSITFFGALLKRWLR